MHLYSWSALSNKILWFFSSNFFQQKFTFNLVISLPVYDIYHYLTNLVCVKILICNCFKITVITPVVNWSKLRTRLWLSVYFFSNCFFFNIQCNFPSLLLIHCRKWKCLVKEISTEWWCWTVESNITWSDAWLRWVLIWKNSAN